MCFLVMFSLIKTIKVNECFETARFLLHNPLKVAHLNNQKFQKSANITIHDILWLHCENFYRSQIS